MMATKRTPRPTFAIDPNAPVNLMDNQNKLAGDSRAVKTERITFCTTPEISKKVEQAAWEQHISKSQFIENALASYLDL